MLIGAAVAGAAGAGAAASATPPPAAAAAVTAAVAAPPREWKQLTRVVDMFMAPGAMMLQQTGVLLPQHSVAMAARSAPGRVLGHCQG